jgi:hypothetical protein
MLKIPNSLNTFSTSLTSLLTACSHNTARVIGHRTPITVRIVAVPTNVLRLLAIDGRSVRNVA